jgi:hypothetical protein
VRVPAADRRFNFAEHQNQRLYFTPNEIAILDSGAELEAFADVLVHWAVDETKLLELVDTQAKRDVHEATSTINQLIADAIIQGDLQFFIDRTPNDTEAAADFHNRFNPIGLFRTQIDRYIESAKKGEPMILKDEDVFPLFRTLIPDSRYFQDSKTWRTRHYFNKKHRKPGSRTEQVRGLRVDWQLPTDLPVRTDKTNVVEMAKGKKK